MDKTDSKRKITIKVSPRKPIWKLPYDVFGHFRRNFGVKIALKDFQFLLENAHTYFLNELGLSMNTDGSPVDKSSAQYLWAQLDKCRTENGEQLYVWMVKKGSDTFGNIAFGTKTMFDTIIVKSLQKQNNTNYGTIQ